MSRGEDQYWENGDDFTNVGGSWICDICGETLLPNNSMLDLFSDGRHICKKCLAVGMIFYFNDNYYPGIIEHQNKQYVISCIDFKVIKKRKNIPLKMKKKILESGKCNYCGSTEKLTIDHIIPTSRGGTNIRENLQVLCRAYNSIKGDKWPINQFVTA